MQANNAPIRQSPKENRLPIKIPLAFAASALAQLADQIESGVEINPTLIDLFQNSQLSVSEAVDRRIAFEGFIQAAIDQAKAAKAAWTTQTKNLERIQEKFWAATKEIVEQNPNIPFKGDLGRFAIQNSNPAVQYDFDEIDMDENMIEMLSIDPKYVVKKVTYRIDKKTLLTDLKAGAELPWARLKQETHLRIKK